MPLNFTTLNNDAAVAKTITEVAKDKTSSSWINSTDSSASLYSSMEIKQQVLGKNSQGVQTRRSLIQFKIQRPVSTGGTEEVICNFTVTQPVSSTVLTESDIKDAAAFVRGVATGTNMLALRQGMV